MPPAVAAVALTPSVAQVQPAAKPHPKPKKKAKKEIAVTWLRGGGSDTAAARGEKLFHDPSLGGPGNHFTCYHCHAKADERQGVAQKDGYARAAHTLYDSAQRPRFWGGFATDVGKGSNICVKTYMHNPKGLADTQMAEVTAFLELDQPGSRTGARLPRHVPHLRAGLEDRDRGRRRPRQGGRRPLVHDLPPGCPRRAGAAAGPV